MKADGSRGAMLLAALLLALVTAVVAVRGVRLARDPGRLDALDERRWYGWATRGRLPLAGLAAVEPELAAGETVWVLAPRGTDREWLRVMARYHLPRQRVHVAVRGAGGPPPGATVVAIDRRGGTEVRRAGDPGGPGNH